MKALTFDDILLVPRHSQILPSEADVKTTLVDGITLNIPLISAAMDTVTESENIYQMIGGLKFAMGYLGASNLTEMRTSDYVEINPIWAKRKSCT